MVMREQIYSLNGRTTGQRPVKNKVECARTVCSEGCVGFSWSSSENSLANAVNVSFASGNINNNNKYGMNYVRAVSESDEIFYENVDLASIYEAYYDCRKNKSSTSEYLQFQMDMDRWLYELWEDIIHKRYVPFPSTCFIVTNPVPREIFAANFRDRVVHHWICMRINPLFEALFDDLGNVSHNCRVGYGTRSAVNSLQSHILQCSQNFTKDCWVARFDFKGFFMSIDKMLLWDMIAKFVKYLYKGDDIECLLYLLKTTIDNKPQENCIKNSPLKMWKLIPKNKSLFTNNPDYGLPIGNLTSQLFANFFLSFFDWFILKVLKFEHYVRYVDDFTIASDDKQRILDAIPLFRKFLKEELHITLHPDKIYIQHATKGIKFVGSQLKYERKYVGNRTVSHFYQTIMRYNAIARRDECEENLEKFRASINSYLGFLKDGNNYATKRRLMNKINKKWFKYIYIGEHFDKVIIKKKYLLKTTI